MNLADRALLSQVASSIDNVHIVLRNGAGALVLDTIVAFPAGQDSVAVGASVNVHGESERFAVQFQLRAGSVTMFEGMQELTAKPGTNAVQPAIVPLTFVGPGARAARVTVTPATTTLLPGATVTLTAIVADSAGAPIPGAVIVWSSSNETSATVNAAGIVTALGMRGAATISARTPSGVSGSAAVNVTLPASKIVVKGGDAQTGVVASTLAQPFAVQVQASDGVGVSGIAVTFAATASGASVSATSATTDASGNASTTATLGPTAGKQSFSASASGLAAVSVNATATRDAASVLTMVSGDAQVDTAGRTLPNPLVVKATDRFGNAGSGVSVLWRRVTGTGSPAAATSTTDSTGQASVAFTLGELPGTETIAASLAGATSGGVTFSATVRARAASRVAYVSGSDQSSIVGTAVPQPLVVRATDDLGNAVAGANLAWTITNGGVLSATSTVTDANGLAQVSATSPTTSGTYFIVVRSANSTQNQVQFQMTALVGAPAKLAIVAGDGQSGSGGAAVSIAPSVSVADKYGNVISGVAVTFTPSSGGSVMGSPATTNAAGLATLGSWTLGPVAGAQSLTAACGTATVTFTATATAAAPSVLSVSQQPSTTVNNTQPFATQPKVQLKTAAGANKATAGVVVTVALKTIGPTLRGTLTATTDGTGLATFTNLSMLGATGTNVLTFSASGYTGDTSATFKIVPGPAIAIAAASATSLSGTVNTVAAPSPTVFVTDSSGNGVGGITVTFAVADTANGAVVGGGAVTDTTGHASPTSWTLGKAVRTDTLSATSAGLAGSPVRFIATATAGAVTQLVKISGDVQTGVTGNPLAAPMMVEARDAMNNPVAGVNIGFSAFAGGGSPATQTVATDALGRANFTLTLGAPGADSVKACLPSCATASVIFTALSIPVSADAIWTGATSTSWSTAANWSPATVPTGANKVFIPAGTLNSPALSGDISLTDLTMASGATLAVGAQAVSVSGNVYSTGATMTGTGYLYFCGGTHTISGGVAGILVDCGATVTPVGSATIAGWLETRNGAVFDVAAGTATATGDARMYSGSRFKMTQAGGHLIVIGNFDSNPGNDVGDTWMTDGVLELKGNLTAMNGCCGQSFRSVGNHIVRFSGTLPQTVSLYHTHEGYHRQTFGNMEVTGSAEVVIANQIRVWGTVTVTGTAKITGSGKYLLHGGQLTTAAGTDLSGLSYTQLNAGGAVFPVIAGLGPSVVQLAYDGGAFPGNNVVSLPQASVTLPTNLQTHSGMVLDLTTKELLVTGTFGMYSGSRVAMQHASAHFLVTGDYDSDAGDVGDTWMTAGVLELKGNLTAMNGCCGQTFRSVGNHIVRFSGTLPQTVSLYHTHEGYHRQTFGNMEVTGSAEVVIANQIRVWGTVTVTGTAKISGSGKALLHGGQLTTAAGTDLSGLSYTQLNAGGADFPLIAGIGPTRVQLAYDGGAFPGNNVVSLPQASVTLPVGTILETHSGMVLDLTNRELIVNGAFGMYSSSRVKMTDPAAHFVVTGDFDSNPGNDVGDTWMTDGVLELKGNLTAMNGCCGQSFRAVGAHITRFSGTSPQTISLYHANEGWHRQTFGNMEVTNAAGAGVTTGNSVRVWGNLSITGNFTINAGHTAYVGGNVSLGAASITTNNGGFSYPTCSLAAGATKFGFTCPYP